MSNRMMILKDTIQKIYDNPTFEQISADLKNLADKVEQTGNPLVLEFKEWISADPYANLGISKHFSFDMPSYHSHDYYELNFCQKGSCIEYVDGQVIVLKEHEMLLMSPGISHTLYCDFDSLVFNLAISKRYLENFDKKLSSKKQKSYLSQFLEKNSYAIFSNTAKTNVPTILSDLHERLFNSDKTKAYKEIYLESETNRILLELSEYKIKTSNFPSTPNTEKETLAEKIMEYIYLNCSDVSLEKISKVFGYSTTHIYRIIKKYTGKSYAEFLTASKIKKACEILRNTNISVSKIHSLIGLSNYGYFYKIFKKHLKTTPSDYRKKNKIL